VVKGEARLSNERWENERVISDAVGSRMVGGAFRKKGGRGVDGVRVVLRRVELMR